MDDVNLFLVRKYGWRVRWCLIIHLLILPLQLLLVKGVIATTIAIYLLVATSACQKTLIAGYVFIEFKIILVHRVVHLLRGVLELWTEKRRFLSLIIFDLTFDETALWWKRSLTGGALRHIMIKWYCLHILLLFYIDRLRANKRFFLKLLYTGTFHIVATLPHAWWLWLSHRGLSIFCHIDISYRSRFFILGYYWLD